MAKIPIALQLDSVRNELRKDLRGTLEAVELCLAKLRAMGKQGRGGRGQGSSSGGCGDEAR